MHRTKIIQKVLNKIKGKVYFEIGISEGNTFKKIKSKHKIGVDIIPS